MQHSHTTGFESLQIRTVLTPATQLPQWEQRPPYRTSLSVEFHAISRVPGTRRPPVSGMRRSRHRAAVVKGNIRIQHLRMDSRDMRMHIRERSLARKCQASGMLVLERSWYFSLRGGWGDSSVRCFLVRHGHFRQTKRLHCGWASRFVTADDS